MVKISKLIIKLADNELSDSEREKLEKKLYGNPKLMKEYKTHMQLNEFLNKEFNHEKPDKVKKKITQQDKSLEAELESIENNSLSSTVDVVKEWKEDKIDDEYSNELKEFASLGLKAKKEKNRKLQQGDHSKEKTDVGKKTLLLNRWYLIAAAVVTFFMVSALLFNYLKSPADNSELFVQFYQPYHFVLEQTRGSDLPEDSLINVATELYLERKYSEASELALNAINLNDNHVKARFIYGLTQLEAKNYTQAAFEFETILNSDNSYHLEARWYLALCYLKLKKTKDAKDLLNILAQSKSFYMEKALELLKKME